MRLENSEEGINWSKLMSKERINFDNNSRKRNLNSYTQGELSNEIVRILRGQKENSSQKNNIALSTNSPTPQNRIHKLLELQQRYQKEPVAINFDTQAKLNLEETILDGYKDSEEFFIAHEDRLYTLGHSVKGANGPVLTFKLNTFLLEESEDLLRLDSFFLEKNQKNIEKYKKQVLEELEQKNQQTRETIQQLRNSFKDDFSMSRYIVKTIFPMHIKKKRWDYVDAESARALLQWEDTSKLNEEEVSLLGSKSLLIEYLEHKYSKKYMGVASLFGKTYLIPSKLSINIDSLKNYDELEDFDDFTKGFKDFTRKTLEHRIKQGFSQRMQLIKSNEMTARRFQGLNDELENVTRREEEDIGFDKVKNDSFVIYRKIPQYIVKKNGQHYLFESAKIGAILHFSGSSIKIDTPGFVYGNHAYVHKWALRPHEFGTVICHHNVNFNKTYGIKGDYQPIGSLKENRFAAQALNTIKVVENVLTYGCALNDIGDMPGQCCIDSAEATRLKKQGIKVYDNDYVSARSA